MTGVASGPTTNQFIQWDAAGSDPIEDVATLDRSTSGKLTGFKPNICVLGAYVMARSSSTRTSSTGSSTPSAASSPRT